MSPDAQPFGRWLQQRRETLPSQSSSFIGRKTELDDLLSLVLTPECRLVTIVGQGGIGKTRLAVELAQRLLIADCAPEGPLRHGVCFVALQAVDSLDRMTSAIADALQLPPPGAADARAHLLACLPYLRILLVLDNLEHLHDGVELVEAILAAGPYVRLVITSRTALHLTQEWRYPLHGLPGCVGEANITADACAERLFIERAQRVLPGFDYAGEFAAIQRICQLVDGIPLAIELAAAWIRALSCTAIASQIATNLAFLTADARNVPARHGSMLAIFDQSWAMLSPDERTTLAQLSVFRGGFELDAAAAVTHASVHSIAALVDNSMLRREANDRYRVHELLRQYTEVRLQQHAGEAVATHTRHAAYYTGFLQQWTEDLNGRRQRLALEKIAGELENVRAALRFALEHREIQYIQCGAYTLYLFYDYGSRYREGADLFAWAIAQLDKPPTRYVPDIDSEPTLAELLVCLGWLSIRLGDLVRARTALERSLAILTQRAMPPRPGPGTDPRVALGTLANVLGDYTTAARLGAEARQQAEAQHDPGNLMYAYYVLANSAYARGRFQEAGRYGGIACQLADQQQDRWFLAYLVADLGNLARATGHYDDAVRHYQAAYDIREEFDDPEGIAVALIHLGQVALLQGEPERAQQQFRQGLDIYIQIGDRGGEATALQGLGMTAIATGNYPGAGNHLANALRLATAIGFAARTNSILAAAAALLEHTGQPLPAAALLVQILRDPACDRETSDQARTQLAICQGQLAPDQFAAATQRRLILDLPELLVRLQSIASGTANPPLPDLTSMPSPTNTQDDAPSIGRVVEPVPNPVVEPLTARELVVLQLMAAGRSNLDIATELVITPGTAKWYVSQILGKLGVRSRTQAIAYARVHGLLA